VLDRSPPSDPFGHICRRFSSNSPPSAAVLPSPKVFPTDSPPIVLISKLSFELFDFLRDSPKNSLAFTSYLPYPLPRLDTGYRLGDSDIFPQ